MRNMSRSEKRKPLEVPAGCNVATSVARALAGHTHDVVCAAIAYANWADQRLLALAVEEQRIVVTHDGDFSDLIYAHGRPPPPAIVYIRCEPGDETDIAQRVIEVVASKRMTGHMAVITPKSTRFRLLPGKSIDNG